MVQALFEQGHLVRDDAGLAQLPIHVGSARAVEIQIPATIEGVLAARIDRLPAAEKLLLQQLAVIGREFALALARQVAGLDEDTLHDRLAGLQRKEFVFEQPGAPQPAYIFKHALTQDVAYRELPLERRKLIHERTADAIETLYAKQLDEHYAALAHHYTQSGNLAKAIHYLSLAGQQANRRSAAKDAVSFGSHCQWMLGYPDVALRSARAAIAAAERTGYPYMICVARILLAELRYFRGEISETLAEASSALDIADEYGFPEWTAFASPAADWARGMQGDANALSNIDQYLAIFE